MWDEFDGPWDIWLVISSRQLDPDAVMGLGAISVLQTF